MIADRIFRTDKATAQLGIREPFKGANRENQVSFDYATRRQENLRVPRARNITVCIRTPRRERWPVTTALRRTLPGYTAWNKDLYRQNKQ